MLFVVGHTLFLSGNFFGFMSPHLTLVALFIWMTLTHTGVFW